MTEQELTRSYLAAKYRNEYAGFAPWPLINSLPEDERRADLELALTVPDGPGGVIGGWLAMSLRSPQPLGYPAEWPPSW